MRAIRLVLDGLYLVSGWLAGLFLLAILILMLIPSGGRPPGINLPAGDDFVAWSMAACAFLGLAHTFRSGEMIRVGLVIDRLPTAIRRWVELVCLAIGTVVVGFFAWHAVMLTRWSFVLNDMAQGVVPVPLWIPQLGYCVGLVVLAIAFLDELVHAALGGAPRYEKPPPRTADEVVERAIQNSV